MKTSDREEFIKAYKKIHAPLMRFCIVKSRGIMDPEDLANDTLLVGLENYNGLKDKKALLSYLFTTANNISLNHLRRKKFSGPYDELTASNIPDLNTSIEGRVDVGILYEALEQLPPLQKEAVILFEISDLPIKEIMVIQNSGESSVKQRIKRGREKLTAIMKAKDRRKIAVVVAVSLTTNSFSMSNLNQYFEAVKLLPLPISETDALFKITQFQLPIASFESKAGSMTLKKVMAVLMVVGGVITIASVVGGTIFPKNTIASPQNLMTSFGLISPNNDEKYEQGDHLIKSQADIKQVVVLDNKKNSLLFNDSVKFSEPSKVLELINWSSYRNAVSKENNYQVKFWSEKDTAKDQKKEIIKQDYQLFDLTNISQIEINDIGEKVEIRTWDKDSIKIESVIEVECKKETDREIILRNIKLISSIEGNQFILEKNSKEERDFTIQIGSIKQRKIEYDNGQKAKYKKLNRSYIVTIPKKIDLKMISNYADIDIEALAGSLSGRIYESTFDAKNIEGDVNVKFKYSKVTLADFSHGDIKTYETRFNFDNCDDLRLDSKYSVVKGGDIQSFILVSYEDNIEVDQVVGADLAMEYSTFRCFGNIRKARLLAYESKLYVQGVEVFDLYSFKYSYLNAKEIGEFDLNDIYESKLSVELLNSIKVEKSKYSSYVIGNLLSSAVVVSYEDRLKILNVMPNFNQLKFDGRYSKYVLSIDSNTVYGLNAKTHYGRFDYSTLNIFNQVLIAKNNHLNLKGDVNSATPQSTIVKFDCYESSIVIK